MMRHCNEIEMMGGSEPIMLNTKRTTRRNLQVIEKSNKVDRFQNAATPCSVLIIRRSLVRVQPPPPMFFKNIRGYPALAENTQRTF
jgi:hypothetical protein